MTSLGRVVDGDPLEMERFLRLRCPGRGCSHEIFLWKLLTHNDSRQKLKLLVTKI